MNTALKIAVDSNKSEGQLMDQWKLAELRRKFWSLRNPERNPEAQRKLHNYELLIKKINEQLEAKRMEKFPTAALMLLIEGCNQFTINI